MKWEELRRRITALLEKMVNDPTVPDFIRQIVAVTMEGLALASVLQNQHHLKKTSYADCLNKVEDLENRWTSAVESVKQDELAD